jgi:hypothetical protein
MIRNIPIWEMSYSRNMHRAITTSTGGIFCLLLSLKVTTHLATICYYDVMGMFLGLTCAVRPRFDIGC